MDDDQQFCLRWNNHQSTLVAVFDTLLENGTLVDCTLAAEGKYLNAHKVVLSACSPYFEALLSQNYDKHPIFILKDVKFQELKAMMDYMYRGEVNISQDQLGALLKAAESLQIKGLSDNKKGETETKKTAPPPPVKSPPPAPSLPKVSGLTIEHRRKDLDENSRDGSQSPVPRRRKRARRRSEELDNNHDASNSSESHHSTPAQNIPNLPTQKIITDVPEQLETKQEIIARHKQQPSEMEIPQVPIIKEKIETHSELMLEPKAEYVDEMNEDSIEDLTLDDDDLSNMEQMDDSGAGPSHGNMGEGSAQGFGWHMGNQNQDEVFLAAQEAVGAHRDSQGRNKRKYICDNCGTYFNQELSLFLHKKYECIQEPTYNSDNYTRKFWCDICGRTFKVWHSFTTHRNAHSIKTKLDEGESAENSDISISGAKIEKTAKRKSSKNLSNVINQRRNILRSAFSEEKSKDEESATKTKASDQRAEHSILDNKQLKLGTKPIENPSSDKLSKVSISEGTTKKNTGVRIKHVIPQMQRIQNNSSNTFGSAKKKNVQGNVVLPTKETNQDQTGRILDSKKKGLVIQRMEQRIASKVQNAPRHSLDLSRETIVSKLNTRFDKTKMINTRPGNARFVGPRHVSPRLTPIGQKAATIMPRSRRIPTPQENRGEKPESDEDEENLASLAESLKKK